jgi:hypothetical protein
LLSMKIQFLICCKHVGFFLVLHLFCVSSHFIPTGVILEFYDTPVTKLLTAVVSCREIYRDYLSRPLCSPSLSLDISSGCSFGHTAVFKLPPPSQYARNQNRQCR